VQRILISIVDVHQRWHARILEHDAERITVSVHCGQISGAQGAEADWTYRYPHLD